MNAEERLAQIFAELTRLGISALVMGGHAVRFYGVDRSTIDYDLVVAASPEDWERLPARLSSSTLFARAVQGPSWRPKSFRRFVLGTLPDGREERLEFWRENHLLASFADLYAARCVGSYGGGKIAFLGLDDLMRSKETEREDDWRDIRLLEEIADERRLASIATAADETTVIARLRSVRGFETALQRSMLGPETGAAAAVEATHPVSRALLAPFAGSAALPALPADAIDPKLWQVVTNVKPGSPRHLALVEAVRRLYQRQRMSEDRADKKRQAAPD